MSDPLRLNERRSFEHFCASEGFATKGTLKGLWDGIGYENPDIDYMWIGWKARAEFTYRTADRDNESL